MNILPKKSWHVLTRANLERVRRDETEAKRIEDEKARRAALADQEAKIEFMRKRARAQQVEGQYEDIIREPETSDSTSDRHINFFTDLKAGIGLEGSVNTEHEIEKKRDQEKWEKKVGILTYLVDKEDDSSPWYVKKKSKKEKSQEDKKLLMDPLNEMKSYMETKRKFQEMTHPSATPSTSGRSTVLPVKSSEATAGDKLSHKSKKKKDKKKKEENKRLLMEKMRAERKRREESERMKSEAVLKKHYRVTAAADEKEEDTASTRYNNQYNPHLSRTKY